MLVLKNIVKDYVVGDTTVRALDEVTLAFRKNEFVSVLGHSGCGKTTMLNIIGGLDKYTDGVMSIKGVTTEEYKNSDWDTYRNHSIGFVFQSYNLIPHQTVLSNVELALTLSGVSKAERRRRAAEVLERVGLGDQLHKKPSQMSGGQMQRVAIARALINDPEILLADEPTGALDTDTSVQIMDILKEISKDKLIIMVTHNPELAEKYSDRIIRLKDGKVMGDSNPFSIEDEEKEVEELKRAEAEEEKKNIAESSEITVKKKKKKPSMSFWTALTLSFNNLLTKKTRTFLTSFAGSIGIIGIALILSLSNGINAFIDRVQRETLSSYPITIQKEEINYASLLSGILGSGSGSSEKRELDKIYLNTVSYDMLTAMMNPDTTQNDLKKFKEYIEQNKDKLSEHAAVIRYGYGVSINAYLADAQQKYYKADVSALFNSMATNIGLSAGNASTIATSMSGSNNIWQEMLPPEIGNDTLIHSMIQEQYDLVSGKWPTDKSEVLLLVSADNSITDLSLYSLGVVSAEEMLNTVMQALEGNKVDTSIPQTYTYDQFIYSGEGDTEFVKYKLIPSSDYYYHKDTDGNGVPDKWIDLRSEGDEQELNAVISEGLELKISGIIRQKPDASAGSLSGTLIYTSALTEYLVDAIGESDIVKAQKADETKDVFTGLPFAKEDITVVPDANKPAAFKSYLELDSTTTARKAEIYKSILTTPNNEEVVERTNFLLNSLKVEENKNNKDALLSIIVKYAGQGNTELATKYFEKFTAEQLYEYIYTFAENTVREEMSSEAQKYVDEIVNKPNATEHEYMQELVLLDIVYANDVKNSTTYIKNIAADIKAFISSDPQSASFFAGIDIDAISISAAYELLTTVLGTMSDMGASMPLAVMWISNEARYDITVDVQRQYLIKYYNELSGLDITAALTDDQTVKGAFISVIESHAEQLYKETKAPAQNDAQKNQKLADAFMKKMNAGEYDARLTEFYDRFVPTQSETSLEENYVNMGLADKNDPTYISIYPNSFEAKESISAFISEYNDAQTDDNHKISYTDYIGLLMSSITSIINAITYVLIFFVSISLVVSSIMIGIITYISVLERTKEIGILRAMGASKRDVSRVFNAETLIVGFASGLIGIIVTLILNVPISIIIKHFSDISGLASLPLVGGIILVVISMLLTLVAGLIPSRIAANKDPVESLRSE